jgi:hypothetical protein
MKKSIVVGLAVMALALAGCAKKEEPQKAEAPQAAAPAQQQQQQPPVAGVIPLGITVDEMAMVANGWSVKKQILGQDVFNDKGEKIGKVEDLIVAPDKAISYGIVSAGSYLGMDKHDVAIPANQLKLQNGKLTLPGATKDSLKAMPPFEYAKS